MGKRGCACLLCSVAKFILMGIFFLSSVAGSKIEGHNDMNIVCYYELVSPTALRDLQPEFIDPTVCTHIILGFATVINDTLIPTNPYDIQNPRLFSDYAPVYHVYKIINMKQTYSKILNLKTKNPALKVILAVGGAGSTAEFSAMVRTAQSRSRFINQSIPFLMQHGFDGFDLDWEFPGWAGDPIQDKELLVTFLKEFRAAVDLRCPSPNHFLISLDVGASPPMTDLSYDIPEMAKYVNFINIMTYAYHFYTWYDPFTAHNSPLFQRSVESGLFANLNTNWSANYYLNQGMPKNKINVGIPTYGNTYHLLDTSRNGLDAPAAGPGLFQGSIVFPLVCIFLRTGGHQVLDEESKVPYAFNDYDWISYEDIRSVTTKATWVKQEGFAGVMTFDLNCDDWAGICDRKTTFPLHRTIQNVFNSV